MPPPNTWWGLFVLVLTDKFTVAEVLQKGIKAHKAGRLDQAFTHYKVIVDLVPGHPDASHNLGVLAIDMGKTKASLGFLNDAVNSNPLYEQYWLTLLQVQTKLGMVKEVRYNSARVLLFWSDSQKLLRLLRKINQPLDPVASKKFQDNTWKLTARSLLEAGSADKLIDLMIDVVFCRSRDPAAWFFLGLGSRLKGDTLNAILNFMYCLDLDPSFDAASRQLGHELANIGFNKPVHGLLDHISHLLSKDSIVRPNSICRSALSLMKLQPGFKKFLTLGTRDYDPLTTIETINEIKNAELFFDFLKLCPIPDVEVELALVMVRRAFLESLNHQSSLNGLVKIVEALAHQCFLNEYIYDLSEEEIVQVSALRQSIENLLQKQRQPSDFEILCVACYMRLSDIKRYDQVKGSKTTNSVIKLHIEEPKYERKIRDKISSLYSSDNLVSRKVREQYEDFPYPRWVKLGYSAHPMSISNFLKDSNLRLKLTDIEKKSELDILIAGCGTGQHSIGTAKRLNNSKVTAIDLSLTSIAYAKRKTEEYGITNIKYIHCDILQLNQMGKNFDLIESVGVLHHMEDPIKGWKALYDCLRPSGLMKIGLYSDLARQHIVEIRKEIAEAQVGETLDERRAFRASLLKSGAAKYQQIKSSLDFFSLSEVTDLLFHVQEHRFTIPQIKRILDDLNLEFCGFEDFPLTQKFKTIYPNTTDLYNLDRWHEFEKTNPEIFLRMYQFWCQKT